MSTIPRRLIVALQVFQNWQLVCLVFLVLLQLSLPIVGFAQEEVDEGDASRLYTRVFEVRPDFLSLLEMTQANGEDNPVAEASDSLRKKSDDPFADESDNSPPRRTAREILERAGVTFPDGASVFFNPVTSQIIIRTTAKAIAKFETLLDSAEKPSTEPDEIYDERGLRISVEMIEIDQHAAAALIHEHMGSADTTALHTALQERIAAGAASIAQSSFLRTRAGKSKIDSTGEHRHPAAWAPPGPRRNEGKSPFTTHTSPQAFKADTTGLTIEVDAKLHVGGQTMDIAWSIQSTELLGKLSFGKGVSEIENPLFYRQKLVTQIRAQSGQWQLLGTFTPAGARDNTRTLILVRADSGAPRVEAETGSDAKLGLQFGTLVEYIDVDGADATTLLQSHDSVDGSALLDAATRLITAGKAHRIETIYLATQLNPGERPSSVQSVREIVYPSEWQPPTITGYNTAVIHANANLVVPATITEFETQLVGSILRVHAQESGTEKNANIVPELKSFNGYDSYGRGESEVKMPLISTLGISAQNLSLEKIEEGGTELLSMQVPVRPKTRTDPTNRRVLIFLTSKSKRQLQKSPDR